jgi:hypothetical protein
MSLFLAKPLSARFPGMRPPTELTKMSEPAIGSCTITLAVVIVAGKTNQCQQIIQQLSPQ